MNPTKKAIPKISQRPHNGAAKKHVKPISKGSAVPAPVPGPFDWLNDPAEDIYTEADGFDAVWPKKPSNGAA